MNIKDVDGRDIGERSDAVLRTAMPGHDDGESHPQTPLVLVSLSAGIGYKKNTLYRIVLTVLSTGCAPSGFSAVTHSDMSRVALIMALVGGIEGAEVLRDIMLLETLNVVDNHVCSQRTTRLFWLALLQALISVAATLPRWATRLGYWCRGATGDRRLWDAAANF